MAYDVQIDRLPTACLFDLQGPMTALWDWASGLPPAPSAPNSLTRKDGSALCFIGPDRWLLRDALEAEGAWTDALRPAEAPPEISIVLVSDTQTFFRVTGPDAEAVISIGCPLDLHLSVFGQDAVSYTEFFGLRALVTRCDDGFDVAVEQSYGDLIADYLSRAQA